jgi:hypothetical protein
MYSDMNELYIKARQYFKDLPERLEVIDKRRVIFRGHHSDHLMTLCSDGVWACDCQMYRLCGNCAHSQALFLQKVELIPPQPKQTGWPHTTSRQPRRKKAPRRTAIRPATARQHQSVNR